MDSFTLRLTLYVATPFLVIALREKESILAFVLVAVFAALSWGRDWKTVGGVALVGCAFAALEALCIHFGMWKYFRTMGVVPLWLPPLWAIVVFFLWSIRPYLMN